MLIKNFTAKKNFLVLIPYGIALGSIGIFIFGIFKNNLSLIKQFKYSFLVFLIFYTFSVMLAIFSLLAVMLMLYVFSGNSPSDENVPSVSSFFYDTFNFYGIIQIIFYMILPVLHFIITVPINIIYNI
ncbi:hypothetical protein BCR36DRAFT_409830 [Piromyces finnis]|uniref:Uncharacterized protein n=1 Tax=Piromyces finnis TaxID=1754191 RepID=A0A1Y1VHY3_9FUNG|nr:hypothetical protein BCR36DRAFT_409830 [Piromyces finnis]|eukprot:ORX56640.1 hypothetical protein BCR36DRAFT_409830 [Piromyces finnis]